MFHQVREQNASKLTKIRILAAVGILCVALFAYLSYPIAIDTTREQGAEALRVAILKSAQQCCAVEGSYPASIDHLENAYGLCVNRSDYVVYYEVLGSNVMPTVTVVAK